MNQYKINKNIKILRKNLNQFKKEIQEYIFYDINIEILTKVHT